MDRASFFALAAYYALLVMGGALLGVWFYGGLWWTARRVPGMRHPALLVLGSLVVRTVVTLAGFYLLMDGDIRRLAATLVGFIAMRFLWTWHGRPRGRDVEERMAKEHTNGN